MISSIVMFSILGWVLSSLMLKTHKEKINE